MTTPLLHSFFVLRNDGTTDMIQRITVTQPLQQQMTALFTDQRGELLTAATDEIAFSGDNLTADAEEILVIASFPIPEIIKKAANNPNSATPLVFAPTDAYEITSIFSVIPADPPEILFQAFDRGRMLTDQASRFAIFLSEGTFQRLNDPALILDTRLSAIYRDGNLYFRSYHVANRIFDLAAYYHQASDSEIMAFLNAGTVGCASPVELLKNIDTIGRKKFALVYESGVLDKVPIKTIVSIAKKHKVTIQTETVKGGGLRVVLPSKRNELKATLSFLNQDIYHAPLTNDGRFLSRSKTKIKD